MPSCQLDQCLAVLLLFGMLCSYTSASPTAEAAPEPEARRRARFYEPQAVVITEDVIPDVMNTTQKVIRVNPLDLPPLQDDPSGSMDSSLYKIQSLLPAHRNYVNSKRLRKARPTPGGSTDSPIVRGGPAQSQEPKPFKPLPKQKHLHFLYNQAGYDGRLVGKHMRVQVAPGAYPVYYVVSKTNGRFGKFPIKGFRTPTEFMKYLLKTKVEATTLAQEFHR